MPLRYNGLSSPNRKPVDALVKLGMRYVAGLVAGPF